MIHARGMGWVLAAGAALSLHLLLFVAVEPSRGHSADRSAAPPLTRYLPVSTGDAVKAESDVRRVRSPVLFSLPSTMGFTQE